jgi:hypothetical protein
MEIRYHGQEIAFPSKEILIFPFLLNKGTPASDYLSLQNKKELSMQLKNKC